MAVQRFIAVILLIFAVAAGAAYLLQRQQTAVLREQIALRRHDLAELSELRREHARLVALRPSPDELASLRRDQAAVELLRTELNRLREQVAAAEARLGQ